MNHGRTGLASQIPRVKRKIGATASATLKPMIRLLGIRKIFPVLCQPMVILLALLAVGAACKRPETALQEHPVQRVDLVQRVKGMTAAEEAALVASLGAGLGVPLEPIAATSVPIRILRVTLEGGPDPFSGRGAMSTTALNAGGGFLVGALLASGVPFAAFTSVKTTAVGAGLGTLLGLGCGPTRFGKNESTRQALGYLPWILRANWEIVRRDPGGGDAFVAGTWTFPMGSMRSMDLHPFLRPLPAERRSEADARQASLRAFAEALLKRLRPAG